MTWCAGCLPLRHDVGHPFIVAWNGKPYALACFYRTFNRWPRVVLTPCQQHGIIHP